MSNRRFFRSWRIGGSIGVVLVALATGLRAAEEQSPTNDDQVLDFRYSPLKWQTAICLPDDPCKTLVDKTGDLLYHHRKYTKFEGPKNREFGTTVTVSAVEGADWVEQRLLSPRVPVVQTLQRSPEWEVLEEAFALAEVRSESQPAAKPGVRGPRNDIILVHVTNRTAQPGTIRPKVTIDTLLGFSFDADTRRAAINGHEVVTSSLPIVGIDDNGGSKHFLQLDAITIPAQESRDFFVLYSGGSPVVVDPTTVPGALEQREKAVAFWEKARLPYGHIQVPDPNVQSLLDSAVRNIWQAREINKGGLPKFQVGPTVYRNLWVVDGSFILEAATILGAGDEARNGIRYMLKQQRPSGAFEILHPTFYKENGIVPWICIRHARLMQDKEWLASIWPQLEKTVAYIKVLRQRTCENDSPLDDGLLPAGEIDGGLNGKGREEYSNTYWCLLGLKASVDAARWLGKTAEADQWQAEYDDFLAAFQHAAQRDLCKDAHGNAYLPTLMANRDNELPPRAQWAFCHAVYPGQIFRRDDPLVAGNLAMLQATEHEGMVCGTGWATTGIWNYFGSFYAHAWLWQGNGRKAAELLYAFGNHAAPTLVWREEQSLRGQRFLQVGDMPHNWASAEFIRLAVHLLALDRGEELHLFEGLPAAWVRAGMVTRLDRVCTPFGPLSLELAVSADGQNAKLKLAPLIGSPPTKIVLHFDGWSAEKGEADLPVSREPVERTIRLNGPK